MTAVTVAGRWTSTLTPSSPTIAPASNSASRTGRPPLRRDRAARRGAERRPAVHGHCELGLRLVPRAVAGDDRDRDRAGRHGRSVAEAPVLADDDAPVVHEHRRAGLGLPLDGHVQAVDAVAVL